VLGCIFFSQNFGNHDYERGVGADHQQAIGGTKIAPR
jgi:hypothetical protein